ncbi:MAG: hemolysin III family protein [Pseudomonadota bacterium]
MSVTEESYKTYHRAYSRAEQISDAAVHAIALLVGLIGFSALLWTVAVNRTGLDLLATGIYAAAFFASFGLSAAYNMWPMTPFKWVLRRYDHAAIYLLIAGSCTVFLSQVEGLHWTVPLITIIWTVAMGGIWLKLAYPGRFERLSLALYLSLGWVTVIAIGPIVQSLPLVTVVLIGAGGLIYSTGVLFYRQKTLVFHNTIWHAFVTVAAFCHLAGAAIALTA